MSRVEGEASVECRGSSEKKKLVLCEQGERSGVGFRVSGTEFRGMTSDHTHHTRHTRPLDLYPFIPDLISSNEDKGE